MPNSAQLQTMRTMIEGGSKSSHLIIYFGITDIELGWWVSMAGCFMPIDWRKITGDLSAEQAEDFIGWYKETSATLKEVAEKYCDGNRKNAQRYLNELGLKTNPCRKLAKKANLQLVKTMRANALLDIEIPLGGKVRLDEAEFRSRQEAVKRRKAEEDMPRVSLVDKFRAQGLAVANPYR